MGDSPNIHCNWWPPWPRMEWEQTFIHELHNLLDCIVNDKATGLFEATFEDGCNACVVADAIIETSETGKKVDFKY